MKTPRILAGVVLLAAALSAIGSVPYAWLTHAGLGGQDNDALQTQVEHAAELDQQVEVTHDRLRAKVAVTHALARGECSLFEAAAQFRLIDANNPQADVRRQVFPGNSPEEKLCRQVIQRVRHATVPRMEPCEVEWQAGRLEAQLGEQLTQRGGIELPSLEPSPVTGPPAVVRLGGSVR